MTDTIKHYCYVCREPITESDILGEFAVEKEFKFQDRASFKSWIHFYHDQSAQDILSDKEYMGAIGFFIDKLGLISKGEEITGEMAKDICKQTAEEFNLEFDKLEMGVKAFYSYTICEQRKGGRNDTNDGGQVDVRPAT